MRAWSRAGRGAPRVPHGFCPSSGVAGRFASLAPVTVLRAPRGWGKTATAAAWLRSLGAEYELAWVTVPDEMSAAEFWESVQERMRLLGLPGQTKPNGGFQPVLSGLGRPLVLGIDNLHLVKDETVDEELVDAARRYERLHVLATSRTKRRIELLAPIEAQGVVYGAPELRLDGAEVHAIASSLGEEIGADEARALSRSVGGWPALVRALFVAGPSRQERVDIVTSYLLLVSRDSAAEGPIRQAMQLAVPHRIDEDVVRALGLGAGLEEIRRQLQQTGFLGVDGQFGDILHEGLMRAYQSVDAEGARRAHALLARRHEGSGSGTLALRHAIEAGEPERVGRLITRHWLSVADEPDLLLQALGMTGAQPLDNVRVAVLRRQAGLDDERTRYPEQIARGLPAALIDWSQSKVRAMDLMGAEEGLREGLRRAGELGQPQVEQRARATLALVSALLGAVTQARSLLRSCQDTDETAQILRQAEAVIGVDTLTWTNPLAGRPDLSALSESGTGEPKDPAALFEASLAAARGFHDGGISPADMAAMELWLRRLGCDRGMRLARWALADVVTCELIARRQPLRARRLITETMAAGPERDMLTARVAFYSGDFAAALAQTELPHAATDASLPPRLVVDRLLLRACAQNRLNRSESAADSFHHAVSVAQTHGLLRPFVLVPRGDLDAIARILPHLQEFLDELGLAERTDSLGIPAKPIELSQGELRVLLALADGQSLRVMASRLFVSANTIKTQVRSIYQKLNVHDRQQALQRARDLQIIPQGARTPKV